MWANANLFGSDLVLRSKSDLVANFFSSIMNEILRFRLISVASSSVSKNVFFLIFFEGLIVVVVF